MARKLTDNIMVGIGLLCFIIVIAIVSIVFAPAINVTNFEECVEVVGAVAESFPRQCNFNGETFVEEEQVFCIAQFEPVCDIDTNTTYSNQCFATGAGAMNTVLGQCPNIIDGVDCNDGMNRGHPPCFTGGS